MLGVRVPPGLPFYSSPGIAKWNRSMDKIKITMSKIGHFLRESRVELRKVTWPTPKEALASTSVVIVVVVIVSLFLGVVDFGLTKIIKMVLG
jgi:preprotein translocase subunit SecE